MSKTDSLHYQLCLEGAKWLHRQKRDINRCAKRYCNKPEFCWSCHRYKYVAVELCTVGTENCDVWGYDGIDTAVIEVKMSHAYFRADFKKSYKENIYYDLGHIKYFCCPKGIIKPEELPENVGLLYENEGAIEVIRIATEREDKMPSYEVPFIASIMSRLEIKAQTFDFSNRK